MSVTVANRLAAGEALVSGWVSLPEPLVAEAVARAGFDAVTLDMQHGLVDLAAAFRGIAAVRHAGSRAVARIPVGEYQTASRLLDAGADAVIAPMIETVEDAARFASFMKYPPLGQRSWGPTRAVQLAAYEGAAAGTAEGYRAIADAQTLAIAMIETRTALDNLDAILALAGIDGVFVGPGDLSVALAGGGAPDVDSAANAEAIALVARRAAAAGKPAGIFAVSGAHARRYRALGYRFITLMTDVGYLTHGARAVLADAR